MKKLFLFLCLTILAFSAISQNTSPIVVKDFMLQANGSMDIKQVKKDARTDHDNNPVCMIQMKAVGFDKKLLKKIIVGANGLEIMDKKIKDDMIILYVSSNKIGDIIIKYMGDCVFSIPHKLEGHKIYSMTLSLETATLVIQTVPAEADIFIDNEKVGVGYASNAVSIGVEHKYRVSYKDYYSKEGVVYFEKMETRIIKVELEPNLTNKVLSHGMNLVKEMQNENTIYEIRDVFDLGSTQQKKITVEVPKNSIIKLTTGKLTNGKLTGSFKVDTDDMEAFLGDVDCSEAFIINMPHLTEEEITDVFPNYTETVGRDFYQRHETHIIASKYIYDVNGMNKIYNLSSGNRYNVRYIFYDRNKKIVGYTGFSNVYETVIPANTCYVGFVIGLDSASKITNWRDNIVKVAFSFLCGKSQSIDADFPDSVDIKMRDYSKIYINKVGKCIYYTEDYKMVCIPKSVFKHYKYLNVKTQTGNNAKGTRIHFLKSFPQHQKNVEYSDYYHPKDYDATEPLVYKGQIVRDAQDNLIYVNSKYVTITERVDNGATYYIGTLKDHIGCIAALPNMTYNYVIPPDCEYIAINAIASSEGDIVDYTPLSVSLTNMGNMEQFNDVDFSNMDTKQLQQKFMHWNVGHFTNGALPSISVDNNDDYSSANYGKISAFKSFLENYKDYHLMLNEYDAFFAKDKNGNFVMTDSLIVHRDVIVKGARNNNYNYLAGFMQKNLESVKYGIFESLKGVSNTTPSYEYGIGYIIYGFCYGKSTLYVMHVHLANRIGEFTNDMLHEIVDITKNYSNIILLGDLNITSASGLSVLTNSSDNGGGGFKILNTKTGGIYEKSHPSNNYNLDWCLYRLEGNMHISGFSMVSEAAGLGLSDHLPITFTVSTNVSDDIDSDIHISKKSRKHRNNNKN